jgi:heme-degrading monooxygenase HmoA
MIARTWRGATKAEDADTYLQYLQETGFAEFRSTPGNQGALGLRRIVDGKAEFLIISLWDSEKAVRRFAGSNPEKAVFYPEDEHYLIERELSVSHYEVVVDSAALSQR